MLRTLLRWLAVAGCAFLVWQVASPWVRGKLPSSAPGRARSEVPVGSLDEGWECVRGAELANERLAALTSSLPRALDDERREILEEGRDLIRAARPECRCTATPCDLATKALDELEEIVGIYDRMALGDRAAVANPATHRARAVSLLEQARDLALR